MSITDSFLKEDVKKLYGSANKLPLPVWLDILGLTGRGADNSYHITTRLIENHGLGLYTEDDAISKASISSIEAIFNHVCNLLFRTNIRKSKIFNRVKLDGHTLDAVYVKQYEVAEAYSSAGETVFPWQKFIGSVNSEDDVVWLSCDDVINKQNVCEAELLDARRKAFEEIRARRKFAIKKNKDSFEADELLNESIIDLLKNENPKDVYEKHYLLETWANILENERTHQRALSVTTPSEDAKRKETMAKIRCKTKEIKQHLCASVDMVDDGGVSQEGGNEDSVSKYYEYKTSLDKLKDTGINLTVLNVENIFNQVKQTDKNLWNITLATFRRDVWSRYSSENDLKKKSGRPRSK